MRRKKVISAIEQQILEEHAELHGLEQQNARAYYSGLMDGLGFALKMLKPNSSVISLTSVWYTDDEVDNEASTDNALMIAAAGYITYLKGNFDKSDFKADGNLAL